MLRTHRTLATNSGWRTPQPLTRYSTCTAAPKSSLPHRCCNRRGGCYAVQGSCVLSASTGTMSARRGDLLVTKFREGEHAGESPPAPAGQPQDPAGQDDDMALCGQPGFELCAPGPMNAVPVVFELGKHCPYGNSFAIVGDTDELGAWDTSKAAKLEWNEGDVWQVSAMIPLNTPVSFKYIELGADGRLVGWGQDICAGGGNMTVLVEPAQQLISAYKVTVDPPMSAKTDPVFDAAEPAAAQPYLTARLDVVATLPLSAAFYEKKRLAVAAGLPSSQAEDLVTDRALVEQGLVSEERLAQKWPEDIWRLELEPQWEEEEGAELVTAQDSTSAAAGAAAAADGPRQQGGGLAGGYSDDQSLADAVAGGLMEAGDDETAAADSSASGSTASGRSSAAAAGRMITSLDVIEGSTSAGSSSGEEDSSSKFDTSAEDEADWVASGPPGAAAAGLTPPASPPPSSRHAKAAAQYHQLNPQAVADADFAAQYRITPAASGGEPAAASSCPPPPDSTKLVSASPSVSSVDVDAPVGHPGKAVYEVQGGSMTPLDPIRVEEGLHLPAKGDAAPPNARVKVTSDGALGVTMRGDDPLSLPSFPEVAAVRGAVAPQGFDTEAKNLGPDEGLLVPPELTAPSGFGDVKTPAGVEHEAQGVGSHEQLLAAPEQAQAMGLPAQAEGLDAPEATMSGDEPGIAPLGFADVQTPSGVQHEVQGIGSHEQLLAPPEQAQAFGLPAQAEGLDAPEATMSGDEQQLAAAVAAAAAAVTAAAATTRHAGGAAAARVVSKQEAAAAVDERSKLLEGPNATPVDQVMAEAQVIAERARSEAEVSGVQEVAQVLREAARDRREQQAPPGEHQGRDSSSSSSGSGKRSSGWLKRWFTGK